MKEKKKRLDYKFLLLFALLQFPLKINGLKILTYVYIYMIPFIYLVINIKWTVNFFRRLDRKFGRMGFIIFTYLIIASILWPFLLESYDFTYVTIYWRSVFLVLLKYTFLACVYELHICKGKPSVEEFCNYHIYSVILYIIVTVICILSPFFYSLLMSIVHLDPGDIINLQNPSYRTRFGWGGWSGYGTTMQCTLAVVFCCNNIILGGNNLKYQVRYFLYSILLIIGNAFYGRTGLVISLVCIAITTLLSLIKGSIKYFFIVISGVSLMVIALFLLRKAIPSIGNWFDWVFSALANYQRLGHFYDNAGTIETIVTKMYWMPDIKTFLLGDGFYTVNSDYYMKTDSGIMRPILFYGVINYILSLAAYFLIVYQYTKRVVWEKMKVYSKKYVNMIFLLCTIITIIFEIKGESFCTLFGMLCPIALLQKEQNGGIND